MSIVETVARLGDGLYQAVHQAMGGSIRSKLGIESVADEPELMLDQHEGHAFITTDGSLISYIAVGGALGQGGDDNQNDQLEALFDLMSPMLGSGDYELSTVYIRSPDRTESSLAALREGVMETVSRYGLDADFVRELRAEQEELLKKHAAWEGGLIALKTKASSVRGLQAKQAMRERQERRDRVKGVGRDIGSFSQDITGVSSILISRHAGAVKKVLADLADKRVRVQAKPLPWNAALHAIRSMIDPDTTGVNWKAKIPGSRLTVRPEPTQAGTIDNVWFPSVHEQLFSDALAADGGVVRHGNRFFSTVFITMEPETYRSINHLFATIDRGVNMWLTTHLLGGDSDTRSLITNRKALQRIAWFGQNSPRGRALATLETYAKEMNALMCQIRVCVTVSAKSKQAVENAADDVCRKIQSWGGSQCIIERGDAAEALISSLPGVRSSSMPGHMIVPLKAAMYYMPLARPMCPWENGAFLVRTPEGKLFNYQAGSQVVQSYNELVIGPTGSGKSNHLARLLISLVLSPGLTDVPYIGILDVGPSMRGLIELLNDLLPSSGKPVASYIRWRNSHDFSKNPFDTMLGVKYLTKAEKDFLTAFLTILFTPSEMINGEGIPNMSAFCSMLIDEAYVYFAETNPRPFSYEVEPAIDRYLDQTAPQWVAGFESRSLQEGRPLTWWEVCHYLMERGENDLAWRAQVHAVPSIIDLPEVVNGSEMLKTTFRQHTNITESARLGIATASRQYPVLTGFTRFSISSRINCIDLGEVARAEGNEGKKMTALMYLLGRQLLVSPLLLDENDILKDYASLFDGVVRDYHIAEYRRNKNTHRQIHLDEFHRVGSIKNVMALIERDMREWRKWRIFLRLASQSEEDFTKDMIDQCSAVWILSCATKEMRKRVVQLLGLSASDESVLEHEVRGVTDQGSKMMVWARTRLGTFSQALVSSVGPMELWNTTTTDEDTQVAKAVFTTHGRKVGSRALATAFPGGGIQKELERQLASDSRANRGDVLDKLAKRAIDVGFAIVKRGG